MCHAQDSAHSEGHTSWKVPWAEAPTGAEEKGVISSQEVAYQYLQRVINLHKLNPQNSCCKELRSLFTYTQYLLQTSHNFQICKFEWPRASLSQVVALVLTCTISISWTLQSMRNGNWKMYKPLRYCHKTNNYLKHTKKSILIQLW